jgi:hypothetical protein
MSAFRLLRCRWADATTVLGALLSHSIAVTHGRSRPVVRNLIGPEQECKALEDIAHLARSQNADAVNEPRAIDGPHLGDVYDTCTRKSCLALPQAHVARHGSQPEVRRDCRDYRGGDGASIEAIVLYDKGGSAPRRC